MALAGADLILIPTAIGWDPNDHKDEQRIQCDAWTTIQRAHAIANGLPVVVSNRVGFESDPTGQTAGITFWGTSFIAGPQGELLAICPSDNISTATANIDLERNEQVRRVWPYFRDRRIDAYDDLLLRYRDSCSS
jgi:N-carbamoylputrescine amidase